MIVFFLLFVYICICVASFVGDEEDGFWSEGRKPDCLFRNNLLYSASKIFLIGHIIIMWDRMGFKWGLKHMNYLLRYVQTVLCCYHGDTVGPPTWNETSCLPVNLFLCLFSLCLSTLKRYFIFAKGTILIHAYVFWYFNPHPNRLVDVSCNC